MQLTPWHTLPLAPDPFSARTRRHHSAPLIDVQGRVKTPTLGTHLGPGFDTQRWWQTAPQPHPQVHCLLFRPGRFVCMFTNKATREY